MKFWECPEPALAAGCWPSLLRSEKCERIIGTCQLWVRSSRLRHHQPPSPHCSVLSNFTVANQGSHSLGESSLPCVKLSHEMYYWTKNIWYLWMHIYSDMTGAVLRSASVGNVFITGSWGSINRTPPPQVAGDHELTLGMQLQSHNQHQCWTWSCSWQIEMYCLFAESRSYGTFGLSRRSVAQAKSFSLLMFTALNTKYLLLSVMLQ